MDRPKIEPVHEALGHEVRLRKPAGAKFEAGRGRRFTFDLPLVA
jgi:hypothetical protein